MTEKLPRFITDAMQGLAFWIGYQKTRFSGYPLPEAAIVAEMCSLIDAGLKKDSHKLYPEVMYKRLVDIKNTTLTKQSRVDIVVLKSDAPDPYKNNVMDYVKFVFEVKRKQATKKEIREDLKRLLSFKQKNHSEARAFLLLAFQGELPKGFVNEESGLGIKGKHRVEGSSGFYCVRRVLKTATSFKKKEKANYVCIIEVFQ